MTEEETVEAVKLEGHGDSVRHVGHTIQIEQVKRVHGRPHVVHTPQSKQEVRGEEVEEAEHDADLKHHLGENNNTTAHDADLQHHLGVNNNTTAHDADPHHYIRPP